MRRYLFGVWLVLALGGGVALAQTNGVSEDDVNAIAGKMYCPVCENIPLDDCNTTTCIQWKAEIRDQLAAGRTEAEIINDFVARFGDHVLGTPQDPLLRALSLVTPWVFSGLALLWALRTFFRWRGGAKAAESIPPVPNALAKRPDEDYRDRLERDILG